MTARDHTPPERSGSAPRDDRAAPFRLDDDRDDGWIGLLRDALRPRPAHGRIGEYELLEEIGHGGQGTVYLAVQPGTGRQVALKLLNRDAIPPGERDRLPREIDALVRLRHPHVVAVHAAEIIDGHAVLVMEFVKGLPCDRWADSLAADAAPAGTPRPPWLRRLVEVFIGICEGVDHAHQRGVIHRDIKPSNVLIDSSDSPRVVDFGIARLLDAPDGHGAGREPSTIGFAGTPTYAAPERLDGLPADTRGDVYSLGVLLYRLLAGSNPFSGHLASGGLRRVVESVRAGDVQPPSSLRPGLPTDLDWIALKAMAVDAERRYQSARDLAADLRRFLAGDAVDAHPPDVAYRLRAATRRHRWPIAAGGLVAAGLVAIAVVNWRGNVRLRAALAETQRQQDLQQALNVLLRDVLRGGNPGAKFGSSDKTVREALDETSARLIAGEFKVSPELQPALRLALAETYVHLGLVESAEQHVRAVLDLQRNRLGEHAPERLEARYQLARLLRKRGRHADALEVQREIVAIRRAGGEPQQFQLAQALTSMGITLRSLKRYEEAESAQREALAIYEQLSPTDENVGNVLASLATLMGEMGRLPEAESLARRAVDVARVNHPDHAHSDLASALCNLAVVLCTRGNTAEGEPMMEVGLHMHRAVAGEVNFHSVQAAKWLGAHYAKQGRWDEAIPLLESALRGFEGLYPAGDDAIAEAAAALQAARVAAGRSSEGAPPPHEREAEEAK